MILLTSLLFYVAAAVPSAAPSPGSAKKTAAAPADEYFGPLKVSAISVRVTIDKLGRAYHARTQSDRDILHEAVDAENALRLWRHAYPHDPWLPSAAYHLAQLYAEVQTPEARKHATAMLRYVAFYFGPTPYGHDARVRLAAGFPPLHAESPLRPSPAPAAGTAAPEAASPSPASASAAPSAPSASPSSTP